MVHETARYLGAAVADLVNLFNPEVDRAEQLGRAAPWANRCSHEVREAVTRHALPRPLAATEIVLSPIPTDPVCLGAATFALEGALQSVGQKNGKRATPVRSRTTPPS